MMKKIISALTAVTLAFSFASCSDKDEKKSSVNENDSSVSETTSDNSAETTSAKEEVQEETTEPLAPTHKETVTSSLGSQITVSKTISREEGKNTLSVPLSEFIQDGDKIESFTFVVYSDGGNIGTYQGGCGISVFSECPSATDTGWYQSENFTAPTQGTYGEITWNVPAEIRDYISVGGEIMFGYWWGNTENIRVEEIICSYTRTEELDVLDTADANIGKSANYDSDENNIKFSLADIIPEDKMTPVAVTFNISSSGPLGKFTGAFGATSTKESDMWYQSGDIAVFTDSSSLALTWIIPDNIRNSVPRDGEIMLGYWWSNQPSVTLDSVSVKYTHMDSSQNSNSGSSGSAQIKPDGSNNSIVITPDDGSFRSAQEIVDAINVGWNLGNTLECYDFASWTSNAETAWGNPKTTQAMIDSVCDAGFNSIRIPVTWGDHMTGDTIDKKWMDRVQEVVDYAYNNGMIVILNMHHDDYTWFTPSESEYASDSAKLCNIWSQISERFKDYGDRLLFEGMNEPRTVGSSMEWMGGTAQERAVINKYLQDFVDTVRASGGNNAMRSLIVTSYAASADANAINDVVVPEDDNIIVSIHYYAPWNFAFGDTDSWSKEDLGYGFNRIKKRFVDCGIPTIIGEFGAVNTIDHSILKEYYQYYLETAESYGLKCFVWDNNVFGGESAFGVFNRLALTWNSDILEGIMNGVN
ncbi:MAG: cellulase family glycosylhydrolase [Ruminococcus sp.]|nr:cellulase family glycosylhydrolase [Ruminococcus sp.]